MAYYSRPEQFLQRFKDLFEANKSLLGINYVATQDENLLLEYPVLDISTGPVRREIHGTQKYLVTFEMSFWIYHSDFEETHSQRSLTDMKLATGVVQFLHKKGVRTLEDLSDPDPISGNPNKIIFGYVTDELPAIALADRSRVIATRVVWQGQSEVNFDDA
jgi:hypothetical protein